MSRLNGVGTKLVGVFKNVGTALLNGLASYGISLAISGIVGAISNLFNKSKQAREEAKKTREEFSKLTDEYTEEIKDIDSLSSKYEELSKKLKDSSISTEEYLSVKTQLKVLQDQLVETYGYEAAGIDLVNGKYEEQIRLLNEKKKQEASEYLFNIDNGVASKENKNGRTAIEEAARVVNATFGKEVSIPITFDAKTDSVDDFFGFDLTSMLSKYEGISINSDGGGTITLEINPDIKKKKLNDEIVQLSAELAKLGKNEKAQELLDALGTIDFKFDSQEYQEQLENMQKAAEAYFISAMDDSGKTLEDKAKDIVAAYNKAVAEGNAEGIEDAREKWNQLQADIEEFKLTYGDDESLSGGVFNLLIPTIDNMFSDIWDSHLKTSDQKLQELLKNKFITVANEIAQLSEAEKNALMTILQNVDIEALSQEDIAKAIAQAQKYAETHPIEVKVKASDAVDSMADMKSAVASLSDLYNQTVLQSASENADSFATFAADPETLNSIEQAFKQFISENDGTEQLNAALSHFEKVSVESFGSDDYAEQMQNAINNLITAYVDQTKVIKNLDETNAEWSKDQLKAMGITNADEVVQSRLNKQVKKTQESIGKLAKQLISYNEVMEKSTATDEEKATALKGLVPYVEDILTLYDSQGNAIEFTFGISEEFVKKHQDDINAIAEGDIDALNRIRLAAAKEVVMRMSVDIPTEAFESQVNQIMDLVAQADAQDIEIGAWLEDTPFLQELARMASTSQDAANAISKAFESMGYTATWVDNPYGKALASVQKSTSYIPASVVDEINRLASTQLNFPSLKIQRTGSSGGGVRANYSAPSSSGSSGGGGGGGGSEPTKPKEESEEMFDWVEVAIQRIEEEISRLDKVVGNTYETWGERNEARIKEIKELEKEYKALGIASSEYFRNAEKVQVNGGKGLNDDDYGENDELVKENDQRLLDEAKAAWATGEYKKKVQQGLLTGDDIEKIANHFLSDTIKEYQEIYQKGVDAQDKEYDKLIELGNQYKGAFDDVKEEYSELIQYITDQADVIDERINRTEKRGYFVSKSYYEDLKALEAQRYSKLDAEYEDLIKKRDEAVASGTIKEGSEAWHQMNQEINGVNLELEKSKTQMVEYNNTIRQLDWDFFDWVEERISRINDEASFLVDLMSNDKLYEDNGFLNNLGHATNAMYAAQYEVYMRQAKDYADERLKLEKEIAKDPANKDLIARYEELVDAQQDAIKGAEQMKDSVKSLVQEGINLYLQSLQKLIDKYKESLSDAKDLYSYQQNIAEQTKNIGNLRKQLTAYEGDDSEETRAVIQRLRTQLKDAETKLKETEWDRYISETESFLSDMYTDMEETLNARLDDIDFLMHDMIDVANENSATVQDTIRTETDKVGYTLTSYFDGIVNGGSVLTTDLNNGFTQISGLMTNVLSVIEQIKNYAATMVDNGKTKVESTKTTTVNTNTPTAPKATGNTTTTTSNNNKPTTNTTNNNSKPATNTTNNNKPARSETDYYGVALAIINGNYGWGNGDNRVSRLKQKGFDATKVQDLVNKIWNEGYVFSGAWVGRYQGITDLSKFAFNKYAKGSKNISKDQLAWTQEKGQELIFRSSDGAMLTPLNAGDKVFTAQMTDNLWELAKGRFTTNIPKSAGGNTINNSNAISITLPNVKNYEEFKTALQNDPKMTSFIQQITLGEVSNGVKLNKKKY